MKTLTISAAVLALALAACGQLKSKHQSREDNEHMLRLIYQRQMIDTNYHKIYDPLSEELGLLLDRNCKAAGLKKYNEDCEIDGSGEIKEKKPEAKK